MKLAAVLMGTALAAISVAARADTYLMDVTYDDTGGSASVSAPGYGDVWTTPVTMTKDGTTIIVYCDDLDHDFYPGNSYDFTRGFVTENGLGQALTEQQSNKMGQIANLGRIDYLKGDVDGAIAAQAAIWSVEYPIATASSTDPAIEADIVSFLNIPGNPNGPWAEGFIPTGGWPGPGVAQAQISGVPETSTWAMMAIGMAAAGFVGLRRNARPARYTF